jgi:hypothetical protein
VTTEFYAALSIEEGDTIILNGDTYRVLSITDGKFEDYAFRIMDDEGYLHTFECDMNAAIKVVCEIEEEEYA